MPRKRRTTYHEDCELTVVEDDEGELVTLKVDGDSVCLAYETMDQFAGYWAAKRRAN